MKKDKERRDIFVPTSDDWSPNFPNNQARLSYIGRISDGKFRVCVWGADDFGMEYDATTEGEARWLFNHLSRLDITRKYLKKLGFKIA